MTATPEPKTVAFVLYPGLTLLDLAGPLQVFASLRQVNDQDRPVVADHLIAHGHRRPAHRQRRPHLRRRPRPGRGHRPRRGAATIKAMGDQAIGE